MFAEKHGSPLALENLAPSENLAPPSPLRIQPPDSYPTPKLLKPSSQSHFSSPLSTLLPEGGRCAFYANTNLPITHFSHEQLLISTYPSVLHALLHSQLHVLGFHI